jgi:hypothetical protein
MSIGRLSETPEVVEALAKVEEYAKLAAGAETDKDRLFYERMRQKWLGIADGWRVIADIDKTR